MLKVLLVVALVAVGVWLLVRLAEKRLRSSEPRIIAPDDDPDFLRGLDRREPEHPADEDG